MLTLCIKMIFFFSSLLSFQIQFYSVSCPAPCPSVFSCSILFLLVQLFMDSVQISWSVNSVHNISIITGIEHNNDVLQVTFTSLPVWFFPLQIFLMSTTLLIFYPLWRKWEFLQDCHDTSLHPFTFNRICIDLVWRGSKPMWIYV